MAKSQLIPIERNHGKAPPIVNSFLIVLKYTVVQENWELFILSVLIATFGPIVVFQELEDLSTQLAALVLFSLRLLDSSSLFQIASYGPGGEVVTRAIVSDIEKVQADLAGIHNAR